VVAETVRCRWCGSATQVEVVPAFGRAGVARQAEAARERADP
jgi:hypothetical protein